MFPVEEHHEETESAVPAPGKRETRFQEGVRGFDDTLSALDAGLAGYPELHEAIFRNSPEWRRLFQHKIVPQMSLEGCLVVAVAGGTNTGKSTLFNLLLREQKSAVCSTAAATSAPVLVTGQSRYQEALENKLFPGFAACALERPGDAIQRQMPEETLWVGISSSLSDSLVLLDTPDVDSIERRHWTVADAIRAAGDVVIAVLTPEKYKDARVVDFFRQAHASGRSVVPVMNKANPDNNYAVARLQLAEFTQDAALEQPVCFVLPFAHEMEHEARWEIVALDEDISLMEYLSTLNVTAVKRRVYQETMEYVLSESGRFIEHLLELRERMTSLPAAFERRATALAESYHPQPGEGMGKLLHEQIRAQRPKMVRRIARANDAVLQKIQPAAAFLKRRVFGLPGPRPLPEAERLARLREVQAGHVKRIANNFLALLLENARDMDPVPGALIRPALSRMEQESIVEAIASEMLGSADQVSEIFKAKTAETITRWWENNPEQRRFLLELDALMVFGPSAMLVIVSVLSAGIGAPEFMALAGPLAGEFIARIMESRFAEQWVGLLKPWQREQREKLAGCLQQQLVRPALSSVFEVLDILDKGCLDQLRRYWELCQSGFRES